MATELVTETKLLKVKSDTLVLRITIGQAQAGGSYVVLIPPTGARQTIQPSQDGEYSIPNIPNGMLSCVTTVQDINPSTNQTSVIHNFNGATPASFPYSRSVVHHNDKVVYDIQYVFT